MARVCEVCGRGPQFGHKISHAHNVTKRRWNLNLQTVRAIVNGATRNECLMRLRRSLEEFVIGGIETTIPLHQRIIGQQAFIDGDYDIHWLEKLVGLKK